MFTNRQIVHSLAFGLVMAAVGFCYATSTSRSTDEESGAQTVESRVVGSSDLRIINAIRNGAYDFGDVCFGSAVTRYVSVTGGVRPYRQTVSFVTIFPGNPQPQTGLPVNSSLQIGAGGLFIGSVASALSITATVTVIDSTMGTLRKSTTGQFTMPLFTCGGGLFRFAVDEINGGMLGQSYLAKVDTIGGVGNVRYTVVAGTLTVDGAARGTGGDLTPVGLDLAEDGTLSGRPLELGQISFRCRAVDDLQRIAKDRTNGVDDQVITLTVGDNPVTSTDVTMLSCNIKGDIGKLNKDSMKFSGIVNLGGPPTTHLFGSYFSMRVGGATYEGRFNLKGQVTNSRGNPLIFSDGSKLTVAVNTKTGQIKGTLSKATLAKLLDATNLTNRGLKRAGMSINISRQYQAPNPTTQPPTPEFDVGVASADLVEFVTRKAGDKFGLDYSLGRIGEPKGGAFQILSVKGQEKKSVTGSEGTAWQVKFMAIPRYGIDANAGFDAISALDVRIGNNFKQRISGNALQSSAQGGVKLNAQAGSGLEVTKFDFNARKFSGSLQTSALSSARTGLFQPTDPRFVQPRPADINGLDAALLPVTNNFTIGVDFDRSGNNADFSGEVGKKVYAIFQKASWLDSFNARK